MMSAVPYDPLWYLPPGGLATPGDDELTVADHFCGAGGSTDGLAAVGCKPTAAANHWALSIESHAAAHPDCDHFVQDLMAECDDDALPIFYESTWMAWFSPSCKGWSMAQGRKQDFRMQTMSLPGMGDDDGPPPPEATIRSRVTMGAVIKFSKVHRYKYVVVENVVDICEWAHLRRWYAEMEALGYEHRTLFLNSMFFGVPQSRDRWYAVFSLKGVPVPDLEFRPPAWCPTCETVVEAIQSWKNPNRKYGRYREQYLYGCPRCASMTLPFVTPALAAIDFSLPIMRIGDRPKPLAEATMRRILAGAQRYWGWPVVLDTLRDPKTRNATTDPLPTQDGRRSKALVTPPYIPILVPTGGTWRRVATSVADPLPTRTGSENDGLLVQMRGTEDSQVGSSARTVDDPMGVITGGGRHQALVIKNFGNAEAAGPMSLPAGDRPLGAITGVDHHALVVQAAGNTWEREPGACRIRPAEHPGWAQPGTLQTALVLTNRHANRCRPVDGDPLPTETSASTIGLLVHPSSGSSGRVRSTSDPLPTQVSETRPALVLGYGGSGGATRPGDEPMPTVTGENPAGLVVPLNGGRHGDGGHKVRSTTAPLLTQTGGLARALVVPLDQRGPGRHNRARTVSDPLRTQADAFVTTNRRTGRPTHVSEPMATVAGVSQHELVEGAEQFNLDDLYFRMLHPREELLPGMGFLRGRPILGNLRDATQQIGQAVTPPVAAAIAGRLVAAWRRGGRRGD